MGTVLNTYVNTLSTTNTALWTVTTSITFARKYLGQMKRGIEKVTKALEKFEDMNELSTNLEKAAKFLKFFPPLKTVAKLVEGALESLNDGSGTFLEKIAELESTAKSFLDDIKDQDNKLKTLNNELGDLKDEITAILPGLEAAKGVFDNASNDRPPSLDAIEQDLDDLLFSIDVALPDGRLISERIAQTREDFTALVTGLEQKLKELTPNWDVFDDFTEAFNRIISKMSFLAGPLDTLMDALSGVFWILEKADWLISKVLDPIIDPIMDALGVTDLVENFVGSLLDLPYDFADFVNPGYDFDQIFPFSEIEDKLKEVFTDVDEFGNTIYQNLLGFKEDLIDDLRSLIDPVQQSIGSDDTDLMLGQSNVLYGVDLSDENVFEAAGGRDVLVGGTRNDTLDGGAGDDLFVATAGDDVIIGGEGDGDIFSTTGSLSDYSYFVKTEEVTGEVLGIYLTYIGSDVDLIGRYDVSGVEWLMFNGSTYSLDSLASAITHPEPATEGDDLIFGTDEAEQINALGGNDVITGFRGKDTIDGGAGNDTVDYSGEAAQTDAREVHLDPTNPRANSYSADLLFNVENVVGAANPDVLVGSDADNRLSGRSGADELIGLGGNDLLIGGDGSEWALLGGRGDDTVLGGQGGDRYIAGRGDDLMTDTDFVSTNFVHYGEFSFYVSSYELYDPFAVEDLPNRIILNRSESGGYLVDKIYDDATFQDTIEGHFYFYGSDGGDEFYLSEFYDFIYGLAGDDLFVGYNPNGGPAPESIDMATILPGDGDDTIISYTGDELTPTRNEGDDLFEMRLIVGNDWSPEADDIFDEAGNVIGRDGPRKGAYGGGNGYDTLDLSHSDLNWIFDEIAVPTLDNVITTTDISPGYDDTVQEVSARTYYTDLSVYDAHDLMTISSFEYIIGSEQSDIIGKLDIDEDFRFEGNGGFDYLYAFGSTGRIYADMGDGDDDIVVGEGVDTVYGGAGNDRIVSVGGFGAGEEFVDAGAGNDYVNYSNEGYLPGTFNYIGGDGLDVLDFDTDDIELVLDVAAGTFIVDDGVLGGGTFTEFEAILGGATDNTIFGDDSGNVLSGGRLRDVITGGSGNDVVYTGSQAYHPHTNPIDQIDSGAGNDKIFANSGFGTIDGGADYDTLTLAGILNYSAERGFETVFSRTVNYAMGSPYEGYYSQLNWIVDLGAGTANQYGILGASTFETGEFAISNIENIVGGIWDDHITAAGADAQGNGSSVDGSDGNDFIIGMDGNDTLAGGRGNDVLEGGIGDDQLTPGSGIDFVRGGAGFDTMDLGNGSLSVAIDTGMGFASYQFNDTNPIILEDEETTYDSSVAFTEVESFGLSFENDVFKGFGTDEYVEGYAGDDLIEGGGGSDTLKGGSGNDTIEGAGGSEAVRPDLILLNQNGARNDYLKSDSSFGLQSPTQMTLEFLMQADPQPANHEGTIFSYSDSDDNNALSLFSRQVSGDDFIRVVVNGNIFDTNISPDLLYDSQLHRFAFTIDTTSNTAQIYVDGILHWEAISSKFASAPSSNGVLVFGQDQDSVSGSFTDTNFSDVQAYIGGIGDIRLYDTVLTAEQLQQNMFSEHTDPAGDANLAHYWGVDAGGERIVTKTAGDTSEALTVETVSGQTPGILWTEGFNDATDGNNHLDGGAGDDHLIAGNLGDFLVDSFGNDLLEGGDGSDTLIAHSGTNEMDGSDGDDLILGGINNDTLLGGADDDILVGDTNSVLFGNDQLAGGTGNDWLEGGKGSDVFLFNTNDGYDVIADLSIDQSNLNATSAIGSDFQVGIDKINLSGFGYTSIDEVFANIDEDAGHAAFSDQGTTIVFWGLDSTSLSSDDFLFS